MKSQKSKSYNESRGKPASTLWGEILSGYQTNDDWATKCRKYDWMNWFVILSGYELKAEQRSSRKDAKKQRR